MNNRDLETNIKRFNQMLCTVRIILNNKIRKDTQKTFYKDMAVSILTYESEIWIIKKNYKIYRI
jgi:hypothetical protein